MPLYGAERYPNHSEEAETAAPNGQPSAAWRSEVASRVSSYRARRRSQPETPSLDFGPEPEESTTEDASWRPLDPLPGQRHSAAASGERGWMPAETPVRTATPFDTDYYRRRNAESFLPPPVQHTSLAPVMPAAEPLPDLPLTAPVTSAPAANDLLDLDLRGQAEPQDASLERYQIAAPEAAEAGSKPPAAPEMTAPVAAPQPPAPAAPDNLIVFRRPLIEPPLAPVPMHDELAEPMFSRPRILEVPEEIMPPVQGSLFPEIQLDAEPESQTEREPEISLPIAVAPVTDRLVAGLIDAGIVAAAGALFAAMAYFALPDMPHTKPFFMALAATSVLFWAVYQHMFLLYAGQTPGMAMQRIRLSSFDGGAPEWQARGARARFMFLSLASVLLGFIWALVDEKALCWHDRVSRTFPTLS